MAKTEIQKPGQTGFRDTVQRFLTMCKTSSKQLHIHANITLTAKDFKEIIKAFSLIGPFWAILDRGI